MCPDKQLLSVYYDGELPSPWKEKMEVHLASCGECRAALAGYSGISAHLLDKAEGLSEEALGAASSRVLESVTQGTQSANDNTVRRRFMRGDARRAWAARVWTRRVSIPAPFAAIAALALIAAFAALLTRGRSLEIPQPDVVAEGINLESQDLRAVNSMSEALRFIESGDFFGGAGDSYVIMRLPENKTFYNYGNPQLQAASTGAATGALGR